MYHRIAKVEIDPWDLAVSPGTFERQLSHLKRRRNVMPLDQFVQRLSGNDLPMDAVAITFDDGYRDNLIYAKPLLEKYGLPATLFLATGWVGSSVPFWWDELAAWIFQSGQTFAHTVEVGQDRLSLAWPASEGEDSSTAWRAIRDGQWQVPQTERQKAFISLWRKLRDSSQAERIRVMDSLRGILGNMHDPLCRPMNQSEIQEMIEGGLITLGAHTVHHPALTCLSEEECQWEIEESAEQCRRITGVTPSLFAYPYGDMNEWVRGIAMRAGFVSACSTRSSHINVGREDLYGLPRLAVLDGDVTQFSALLIS